MLPTSLSLSILFYPITSYQLDDKLVSKLGQLLDPYSSDLSNVQVGTSIKYGCWCHFEVRQLGANKTVYLHNQVKGNVVDELDQNCKILAGGYRCGVLDEGDNCQPWEVLYNQPTDLEEFCHYENHGNVCETNACVVETNFINSLSALVESGFSIDSFQFGHGSGNFDDGICKGEKSEKSEEEQFEDILEKHQECCGEYPERYLYKTSGSTECCGGELYKSDKFECCHGEIVKNDHFCEVRSSPCESNPCANGICKDSEDKLDYDCICDKSFIGKNCDIAQVCHLFELYPGLGFTNPCQNGGTCVDLAQSGVRQRVFDGRNIIQINSNFRCECEVGFTGDRCETSL